MSNFCSNCGQLVPIESQFCPHCGIQLAVTEKVNGFVSSQLDEAVLQQVNKNIKVQNNQSGIVKKSLWVAVLAVLITILTLVDGNSLFEVFPLTLLGIFVALSALIVAYIFRSRAKKLDTLLSGENVLASWILDEELKRQYVHQFYEAERAKNKALFWIVTVFMVLIFGAFILFMDEGRGFMLSVMIGVILLVALFAFTMPNYYKNRNLKGDGQVLIGKKFAYINGFFHNWDFPLSGLEKVKVIQTPFYGLYLKYYYTDRTLTNTEELHIPAPKNIDLQEVVSKLNS